MVSMIGPWFEELNYRFFGALFRFLPPTPRANRFCEFLISNPLLSTWIIAMVFYRFWIREDGETLERRVVLTRMLIALVVAVALSLLPRPWVHWPAPNSNPPYELMFPRYLRGTGTQNCFPSHSTLVYFTVALGLWPIDRRWSTGLILLTLACISLPRVYIGGHYAVDVVASIFLSVVVLVFVSRARVVEKLARRLVTGYGKVAVGSWIFLLWTFELGEGFRGSELVGRAIGRFLTWP